MALLDRIPPEWRVGIADWRARTIRDPVTRLRYLRRWADLTPPRRRRMQGALLGLLLLCAAGTVSAPMLQLAPRLQPQPTAIDNTSAHTVWLVETKSGREYYSNALQVESAQAVANRPRAGKPMGVVFHTSESQMADWSPEANQRLKLLGQGLLSYVRREKAYHFMVDRFGRVHRVVKEEDVAFHAGHSVWADQRRTYVNLNEEFLAVSFESETQPGEAQPLITAAQIRAGRMLTEMLRSRYGIAAANCVTHAQVSVNPRAWRIGWHTDWAGNFPFEQMGLPDNYQLPVAAVERFGFSYDPVFFQATGARMLRGVEAAEASLKSAAEREGIPVNVLRKRLREEYRHQVDAAKAAGGEETARAGEGDL